MIRGYFDLTRGMLRPFVDAALVFPALARRRVDVRLLINTGADRTVLSPGDALPIASLLGSLPPGPALRGVGGTTTTRRADVVITMATFSANLTLTIFSPSLGARSMPSVLGRDVLSHFALVVEERTDRVLLLTPDEADRVNWP